MAAVACGQIAHGLGIGLGIDPAQAAAPFHNLRAAQIKIRRGVGYGDAPQGLFVAAFIEEGQLVLAQISPLAIGEITVYQGAAQGFNRVIHCRTRAAEAKIQLAVLPQRG